MENGEQCVLSLSGVSRMLRLCADNWAIPLPSMLYLKTGQLHSVVCNNV